MLTYFKGFKFKLNDKIVDFKGKKEDKSFTINDKTVSPRQILTHSLNNGPIFNFTFLISKKAKNLDITDLQKFSKSVILVK